MALSSSIGGSESRLDSFIKALATLPGMPTGQRSYGPVALASCYRVRAIASNPWAPVYSQGV